MSKLVLNVEVRETTGTGPARASRREGNVPGVIYGGDLPPVAIDLRLNEVTKGINTGQMIGHMISISHKGKLQKVLTREIQFHKVKGFPMHVDLYRVKETDVIDIEVHIHLVGEDVCPGLKKGGTLNIVRHMIEISCPAGAIPEAIEVDISKLQGGETIHISDLTFPKGVSSAITDRDPTVLSIAAPRGASAGDDEAEAGEA